MQQKIGSLLVLCAFLNGCSTYHMNAPLDVNVTAKSPCFDPDYEHALQFAQRSLDTLNGIDGRAAGVRVVESTAAFAIATTAGGVAAFGGAKDILRGLAIGGAAVLGIDELAAPAKKATIVATGRKALYCAAQAAIAVHAGPTTEAQEDIDTTDNLEGEDKSLRIARAERRSDGKLSNPDVSSFLASMGTMNDTDAGTASSERRSRSGLPRSTDADSPVAMALSAQMKFLGVDPSAGAGVDLQVRRGGDNRGAGGSYRVDLATLGMLNVAKAANAQLEQEAAVNDLKNALEAANANAGVRLALSVCQINDEVVAQLRSAVPTPEAILKKQQTAVAEAVAEALKAEDKAAEEGEDTATPTVPAASDDDTATCENGEAKDTCKAKKVAALAEKGKAAVARAEAIFDECVHPTGEGGSEP
jgi:hypothetical protein